MNHAHLRSGVLVLAVAALALAGCSKNIPCTTDPSQIESARADVAAAGKQLDAAKADVSAAEKQKAELTQQLQSLPDKAALEAKLAELKKGSGR